MKDPHEAEEVLQETFISAFKALPRFEGRSQLSTWLYRIGYNAALMRLRKRRLPTESLDEPVTTEEGDMLPRELVDWGSIPDELLLNQELRTVLDAALETLPESLRTVFVLRDIEGLSTAEAAEALGLTETNAKVRLHRARLALRERLTGLLCTASGTWTSKDGRADDGDAETCWATYRTTSTANSKRSCAPRSSSTSPSCDELQHRRRHAQAHRDPVSRARARAAAR